MRRHFRARQLPLVLLDLVQALTLCATGWGVINDLTTGRSGGLPLLVLAVLIEVAFVYTTTVKEVYVGPDALYLVTLLGLRTRLDFDDLRCRPTAPARLWRELWVKGHLPLALAIYGGPLQPFSREDCDELARLLGAGSTELSPAP